ncbi:YkoP family protein [Salibacterium aidingense]|uniref:YkoP family protein n=1 Tax=Salibacterium aidingense TaxID=384933 RepID=UPI00040A26B8|nr:hypothetical protein [Salibacterium aidingense]
MRNYFVYAWTMLDPFYYRITRLTYIPHYNEQFKNIFRVRLTSYKGAPFTLSDETKINKHDTLVKIHLHNIRLLNEMNSFQTDIQKARYVYKIVQQSLPGLANYIQSHSKKEQIKGIVGITTLNKGCDRLGFESFDITNSFYKWWKMIPFFSINLLSTPNASFSSVKKKKPKYIFMSKDSLLHSYKEKFAKLSL